MSFTAEIQLIALLISLACALPGCFLVLRGQSMMTDSLSHTVLLGIVLFYFLTHDLNSPILYLGATAMGLFTVWLTETLGKTLNHDAAMGLVFPFLFSLAIILLSKYSSSIHLDVDTVLLGELTFAPLDRVVFLGRDWGARGIYKSGFLLLANIVLITLFFKELKLATFDPLLASTLGFSPVLIHYGFMSLVSVTAVGAFDAVGTVLVVAFMTVPPNTALLLTHDLKKMLILSCVFGALSTFLGFPLAYAMDLSIPGTMATVSGLLFALVFVVTRIKGGYFSTTRQKIT